MNVEETDGPFPARDHDHDRCVVAALRTAAEICAREGARLTQLRRRVLELVWDSHVPVGAYDILDRLNAEGRRAAPIAVYRALDFLMQHGFVHRLASLNAYVGCGDPTAAHDAHFLICGACHSVAELRDRQVRGAITEAAARAGFAAEGSALEVRGLCPECDGRDG